MDPFTTFSLACGIIQVVNYSSKLVSKIKGLHSIGRLEDFDDIEQVSKHLSDLRLDVAASPTIGNSPIQKDLIEMSKKCSVTAQKILAELDMLKVSESRRKRDILQKSVRSLRKKSTIEELEKTLNTFKSILETKVLVDLRRQMMEAIARQDEHFRALNKDMQNLAVNFAGQNGSFIEFAELLATNCDSVKAHVSREFQDAERRGVETRIHQKVLASLFFPEIYCRQERIKDAHAGTFEWIFDRSGQALRPWSPFVDWLEQGQGTYWINGKAGSGKSTLMNFIWQDPRTREALEHWAAEKKLLVPVFFFGAGGSDLQKTITGLLRSLIYQILEVRPHIVEAAIWESHVSVTSKNVVHFDGPLPIWTEKRLLSCLDHLAKKLETTDRVCLFIDGLDEFEGDQYELVERISNISKGSEMKCCLSSRPEKPFECFGSSDRLRLQDLTQIDIRNFISDELGRLPLIESSAKGENFSAEDLVDLMVEKAEGVFLWVELAVKSQVLGLRNYDDRETLKKRLDLLPLKIEELYLQMLQRIDTIYVEETARYLEVARVLSRRGRPSLFRMALVRYGCSNEMRLSEDDVDLHFVDDKCALVKQRIGIVCAGFLEEQDEEHVGFFHRTAKDFFDSGKGRHFLNAYSGFNQDPRYIGPLADLAELRARRCDTTLEEVRYLIARMMADLYKFSTQVTLSSLVQFLDYIDETITKLRCQNGRRIDDSHWSQSWGYDSKKILNSARLDGTHASREIQLKHLPTDFFSFAAMWSFNEYVEYCIGDTPQMSKERASQLAVCSSFINFSRTGLQMDSPKCSIVNAPQLHLIMRLKELGADLFLAPSRSRYDSFRFPIWSECFHYIIWRSTPLDPPSDCCLKVLDSFMASCIGSNPVLRLVFGLVIAGNEFDIHRVSFEVDATTISLVSNYEDRENRSTSTMYQEVPPERHQLRIWFHKPTYLGKSRDIDDEYFLLSSNQAEGLARCLLGIFEAAPGQDRKKARVTLQQTAIELFADLCFPLTSDDNRRDVLDTLQAANGNLWTWW